MFRANSTPVFSDYDIALNRAGKWRFDDFARNVVIFGVDNSSSIHTENRKNSFLVLED